MSFDLYAFRVRPGFTLEDAVMMDEPEEDGESEANLPRETLAPAQMRAVADALLACDATLEQQDEGDSISLTGQEGCMWEITRLGASLHIPYGVSSNAMVNIAGHAGKSVLALRDMGFKVWDPQADCEVTSAGTIEQSLKSSVQAVTDVVKPSSDVEEQIKRWWKLW
jgi:hypothetical protein